MQFPSMFAAHNFFENANTKDYIETLASIQPKSVVPTPYLLCTKLL